MSLTDGVICNDTAYLGSDFLHGVVAIDLNTFEMKKETFTAANSLSKLIKVRKNAIFFIGDCG